MLHITEASHLGLIELQSHSQFRFAHDKIREAYLSEIPEDRLPDLNQKIAETFDEMKLEQVPLFAIAGFYNNGRIDQTPQRAFDVNVTAGQMAMENFAIQDCHRFLAQAESIALKWPVKTHWEFYYDFGRVLNEIGEFGTAVKTLLQAATTCPDTIAIAHIKSHLAQGYIYMGNSPAAL